MTLPAQDRVGRPLLEEGRRPSEAPATCPTRDPEQGWDRPRVLTLNRPSRTQSCLSRLLATRILATDRPQLRFVLPIGVTGGTQLARARAWRAESGVDAPSGLLGARCQSSLAVDGRFSAIADALADRILVPNRFTACRRDLGPVSVELGDQPMNRTLWDSALRPSPARMPAR